MRIKRFAPSCLTYGVKFRKYRRTFLRSTKNILQKLITRNNSLLKVNKEKDADRPDLGPVRTFALLDVERGCWWWFVVCKRLWPVVVLGRGQFLLKHLWNAYRCDMSLFINLTLPWQTYFEQRKGCRPARFGPCPHFCTFGRGKRLLVVICGL